MNSTDEIASLKKQLDKLEEEILSLEILNHDLKLQVKHYDFDRYKLLEIQRLAKAGTWELNHLTYMVTISDELSVLLYDKSTPISGISWHDFLDMIVTTDNKDIKKALIVNVIQNGKSLDLEHYLKRPDGNLIYVRHHCKTFYNSIGQPLITVGMIHDFTFEHSQSFELIKRSLTDELTHLYNRRHINHILKEQHKIFLRYHTTSSYIMIDIDHFKRINDSFGHLVGDEVLQKIAKYIKAKGRSVDFAGRWGGEEFLIICPNTSLENAVLIAEKLRKGFMKLRISTGTVITASFGVGEISEGECTKDLLKRIDDALYQAKENGRNRLVKSIVLP
jgi:diguanylate cyclase